MEAIIPRSLAALRRLLADERASTVIEYALIASGISIAVAATAYSIGSSLRDNYYQKVDDALAG